MYGYDCLSEMQGGAMEQGKSSITLTVLSVERQLLLKV